jgi:hypothetical protein
VSFVTEGENTLISQVAGVPGLGCAADSNVTLQAVELGSLSATTGGSATGIGGEADGFCESLTVVNGSVSGAGGTGIGSRRGRGRDGAESRLGALSIHGGEIRAKGMDLGCGIGTASGETGSSTVVNLTIVSGNITASSSSSGAGIGSGRGYYGNSTVVNLTIVSGNITASDSS